MFAVWYCVCVCVCMEIIWVNGFKPLLVCDDDNVTKGLVLCAQYRHKIKPSLPSSSCVRATGRQCQHRPITINEDTVHVACIYFLLGEIEDAMFHFDTNKHCDFLLFRPGDIVRRVYFAQEEVNGNLCYVVLSTKMKAIRQQHP